MFKQCLLYILNFGFRFNSTKYGNNRIMRFIKIFFKFTFMRKDRKISWKHKLSRLK